MRIIAVDDERAALRELERALNKVVTGTEIALFLSAQEALAYAMEHIVDIAFLDIEMAEMHGLVLAKNLKDIYGDTNIIFVTGYSQYTMNAFDLHASGYILKPINAERITKELENLRNPVKRPDIGVRIQCFGNFEVFVDGKPISFGRAKAKEMFAYLVDRHGASCGNKEIAAILWEEEPYDRNKQKQLDTIIIEMLRSLDAVGMKQVIVKSRGAYALDITKVHCDLYAYEKGDTTAVNHYHGKYMENYSWAEFTAGRLNRN